MIKSVDPERIELAVRELVADWVATFPEVEEVIWFGSWVRDRWGPASDVDLCVILRGDSRPIRDRIPDFLPRQFPVGVDVFPYTKEEFDRLIRARPGWRREVEERGRVMYSRTALPSAGS